MVSVIFVAMAVVIATSSVPAQAAPHPVKACEFVTVKDARALIGPTARTITGNGLVCQYVTDAASNGTPKNLLVQVWTGAKPSDAPASGRKTAVSGTTARYITPPTPTGAGALQSVGTLASYRKGKLYQVAVAGTSDDLGTAKAAMGIAFKRR